MLINKPPQGGQLLSQYPVERYDHVFECVMDDCKEVLTVNIMLPVVPGKIAIFDKLDFAWRCRCGVVQMARAQLPMSIPKTEYAELLKQGGDNGDKPKRKRKPKKKDGGKPEVKDA